MRQRTQQEQAINSTLDFLNKLQSKCEGGEYKNHNTSQLHRLCQVSNSTFSACVALGLCNKNTSEWIAESANRPMALQVMNYLLEKSKKQITVPIDGLGDITTSLKEISERLASISTQNERALNGLKSPQTSQHEQATIKGNDLFTTTDKKEQQRFEIFLAVISGSYQEIGNGFEAQAKEAVIATNHLFNQYFKS